MIALEHLPRDLLRACLLHARDLETLLCARQASHTLCDALDDDAFRCYAWQCYGQSFWDEAAARPARLSAPLRTWREELVRIERFQAMVESVEGRRWTPDNFRAHWRVHASLHRRRQGPIVVA